jgi:predicted Ser/Thr protein kinase
VRHVVKQEKIHNPGTNADEDPDEGLMCGVEEALGVPASEKDDYRRNVMSRIAAWAIEHPGQKLLIAAVLPGQLRRLRESYFEKHRQKVAAAARHALRGLDQATGGTGLDGEDKAAGERLVAALVERYGYCRACAKDGIARLLIGRFGEA